MYIANALHIYERQIIHQDNYGPNVSTHVMVDAKILYDDGYPNPAMVGHIREHFHRRCSCEHDCCACWNGYIHSMKKVGKHTWTGIVSYNMNV